VVWGQANGMNEGGLLGQKADRAAANLEGKREIGAAGLGPKRLLGQNKRNEVLGRVNCFFELIQGFLEFKSKGSNISKPNLKWIQNRENSNNLLGTCQIQKFGNWFKYSNLNQGLNEGIFKINQNKF
jgi:hypothetical protein